MTLINDIRDDYKRITGSAAELKTEDAYRRLAPNDKQGYRLPLVFANNDLALTKTGAYSGFMIAPKPWGFLDDSRRKQYIRAANGVFERIFPAAKDNSGHLLVTNRVYSADEWKAAMAETWKASSLPSFEPFLDQTAAVIGQREFFERECYLFTRLGSRGGGSGIRGLARWLIETIAVGAGLDDSQPDPEEVDFWTKQARNVEDTLSNSWLQAVPISRRRMEWLVRHLDTPGMPTPDYAPADAESWGAGEWRTTLASYTREVDLGQVGKDRLRCVEFTAPVGAGKAYAAYLPLNIVPSHLYGGQNWAHHASTLPFAVDLSLHFEIVDPDRAEKVLERPITAAETQEEEDRDAGVRTDDATAIQQQGLRDVKTKVRLQRKPLSYWQAVFCVYSDDKDELLSRVTRLIRHYKDIQMELVCPRDDQRELFYQSFPGSDILVQDWMHRTDTLFLAASMPWLTSNVGDRDAMGLYQGFTFDADANGTLQQGVPVMTDLWSVVDDEGKAPTEVVCGFPGSGKTVSRGLKVALEDGLRGLTQFIWDPKGDFLPLSIYAEEMRLDPHKVKLVDLYNPNVSVSLDPFSTAEVDEDRGIDERGSAALDTLNSLCQNFLKDAAGTEYRSIIQEAVTLVLSHEEQGQGSAKMLKVLALLNSWAEGKFGDDVSIRSERRGEWQDFARNLVQHLRQVEQNVLGRLLFRDPDTAGSMRINEGDMIIFVALKMNPTEPGEEPTFSSMISDVIAGMMADFIRALLFRLPAEVPKSAVFDEWHVIKRTHRAEALADWLRRMGRSRRCCVRQMSQSALDFSKGSLSTVWAGYAQNEEEATASCALLGIEPSEANIGMLQSLRAGQFVFRDVLGRVARVEVDIWDEWLLSKFNTSAKDKAEALAALAA